jgi:multiple sugar transport system permease protein
MASVLALAPIYWLITISLKREVDQFSPTPLWFRFAPTLSHYHEAFWLRPFGKYLWNSAAVASLSTLIALGLGIPAAYALARFSWTQDWKERIAFWILSTRMMPPIVICLPLLIMLWHLRLLNTLSGLIIVYTGFNLPFVIWMMRGFFEEIPADLEEAAWLDGDSRMRALLRITLPVAAPGLAATAVFCLIVAWNEFLFALVLSQTDRATTLPVGIASSVTQYEIKWGAMSAAGVVATVPVLLFAIAVQKYMVRGISLGAVK